MYALASIREFAGHRENISRSSHSKLSVLAIPVLDERTIIDVDNYVIDYAIRWTFAVSS